MCVCVSSLHEVTSSSDPRLFYVRARLLTHSLPLIIFHVRSSPSPSLFVCLSPNFFSPSSMWPNFFFVILIAFLCLYFHLFISVLSHINNHRKSISIKIYVDYAIDKILIRYVDDAFTRNNNHLHRWLNHWCSIYLKSRHLISIFNSIKYQFYFKGKL